MEWHHTGGDKEFNVSKFVNSNYPSAKNKEKVLNELSKCILVCANCHRELHRGGYKITEEILNNRELV